MLYRLAHRTDDIVGRTGRTIDWPSSIPGFQPEDWNNYVARPPVGWNWQKHLDSGSVLKARSAVKPFALHYEYAANLVLISETLFEHGPSFDSTLSDLTALTVRFGTRKFQELPYYAASLVHADVLRKGGFSSNHVFFQVETSAYHMHGTLVLHGEEQPDENVELLQRGITFPSFEDFAAERKRALGSQYYLESAELYADDPPLLFSTPVSLYCREDLCNEIERIRTPGVGFPYPPIRALFRDP